MTLRSLMMLCATVTLSPALTGFVLLGSHKSKLASTAESPTIEFHYDLDGDAPGMSDKASLLDGRYADLSDKDLMPVLLQIAMDQWNNVRGSYLRLELNTTATGLQRSKTDRVHVIAAETNTNASTAAFATPETNPDDPLEIMDCDISIALRSTTATSLLETITHELGHCVGLGHPHNNYGAIMSYSRGGNSFRLGADDKAGVIFLYPDPAYVDGDPKEYIGCGNIGTRHKTSAVSTIIILCFPFALALLRRRRAL